MAMQMVMRLNKANALRCGRCDYQWHVCLGPTHVHGGRKKQTKSSWKYTGWEEDEDAPRSRKSSASPHSSQRGVALKNRRKKKKKKEQKNLVPDHAGEGEASRSQGTSGRHQRQAVQERRRSAQRCRSLEVLGSDIDEDDMKVETSDRIQQGIATMVEPMQQVRVQPPPEEPVEEGPASKKSRPDPEQGESGAGSKSCGKRMLQPFARRTNRPQGGLSSAEF